MCLVASWCVTGSGIWVGPLHKVPDKSHGMNSSRPPRPYPFPESVGLAHSFFPAGVEVVLSQPLLWLYAVGFMACAAAPLHTPKVHLHAP